MYQCINESWLCNSSNFALHYNYYKVSFKTLPHQKGTWHRDEWLSLFQFYIKTFLRSVDRLSNQNTSNFNSDLSLKLSQGEVRDLSGEVQKFSGEVQNDLRRGAHLPTPPLKIWPWLFYGQTFEWRLSSRGFTLLQFTVYIDIYKNVYVRKVVKYVASLKLVV
jgi:hypothetical protein